MLIIYVKHYYILKRIEGKQNFRGEKNLMTFALALKYFFVSEKFNPKRIHCKYIKRPLSIKRTRRVNVHYYSFHLIKCCFFSGILDKYWMFFSSFDIFSICLKDKISDKTSLFICSFNLLQRLKYKPENFLFHSLTILQQRKPFKLRLNTLYFVIIFSLVRNLA